MSRDLPSVLCILIALLLSSNQDPVQPVQVDDDIQEVIPVKTEPALASAASYTGDQGQQVATYDEENYTEYGEYEDQQGYTEAGMMDFNQSMDGNKGNKA